MSFTKETLQTRLQDLHKQKAQLDNMTRQASEQALIVAGHINETTHWLNTLVNAERAEAEAKAAEKATKAAQGKKKTRAKRSPVKVVETSSEPTAQAA